ncbi:YcjF family protein [Falsirhodobacter xinxiangensis]|uniref:YcjF family protein n=1 Tax=Falsirhodobacter xinxiangensis TaxID=2530049 RepID=UPI0010AA2C23|nr:TIGR01620 family protein [Rhodobacter xinxiangensis]
MKKPLIVDWEDAADPSIAPPVPDTVALQTVMRVGAKRPSRLWKFALWAFGAAFSFVLSVAAYDFVATLLSRNTVLGAVAFALLGLAALAAFMLAGREALAYLRLGRLDRLRVRAEEARVTADVKAARSVVQGIEALYAHRPEMKGSVAALRERQADVFDADALLAMTELELLAPLDQAARREIEAAARQVATVTALVPVALADVATALYANLRMVRRIAEIYGGRAGNVGSLKLMQRVFGYLVATGALAVGDDLIGSVAGGGLLSRVSRRFGEGVINGALTARIGVAAMELSRPMAFHSAPKPKIPNLLSRSLTGLWEKAEAEAPATR